MAPLNSRLRGSITALATPFRHGDLDVEALARLAWRQLERGAAALVVCGSTGEAASMTEAEQTQAVAVVVATVAGRIPVLAGCTATSTAVAAAHAVAASHAGADGLLIAAPPYVKPTQDGIIAHVRCLSHAGGLPIMLYDVPGRTGVQIADATVARLHAAGLIVALKDATADLARPPRLLTLCGPELAQFTGDDATAAAHLAMGGVGCVSVTANLAPALCASLQQAWVVGDLARFTTLRDQLDPLHQALFAESNPIPLKAGLARLHLCDEALRLPLTRATLATRDRLYAALDPVMEAEERLARRPSLVRAV